MTSAIQIRDHDEIRKWAEERGGIPTIVKGTGGLLRIDFIEGKESHGREPSLEETSWERWFEIFEDRKLTFLCSPEPESRFFKLIAPETAAAAAEHGHPGKGRVEVAASRREERSGTVAEKSTKARGGRGGRKPDLNTMSVEELAAVEGFDETRARQIVDQRERSGGFKSWGDVREVEGIGSVLLEKLKRATTLQEVAAEREEEGEEEEKVNAIPFLMWQHREVESTFEEFEGLDSDDVESRRSCFERIADLVAAHNEIEERIFYPGSKVKQTEQMLQQSAEEHLESKRILAQLMDLDDLSSDEFTSGMGDLKETVLDHVRREEDEVMPLIEQLLPAQALEDMGMQMQDLYLELIRSAPREKVPEQTEAPIQI